METLEFFLDLARQVAKPVCLHVRDRDDGSEAFSDVVSLLKSYGGSLRGVVHCFTGPEPVAVQLMDMGFHLSFTGILSFKSADGLRSLFSHLPADRILLETDAPYLAPVPYRGKRNEPAYVRPLFSLTAALRKLGEPLWSERLIQTQRDLFGLRCG